MAASLTLALAVGLSLIYCGLSLAAFPHIKPEKRKDQREWLAALMLWWPFYADLYDGSERERRLRLYAKLILPVTAAAYIAYFAWLSK
jgi:hypothetical protein